MVCLSFRQGLAYRDTNGKTAEVAYNIHKALLMSDDCAVQRRSATSGTIEEEARVRSSRILIKVCAMGNVVQWYSRRLC